LFGTKEKGGSRGPGAVVFGALGKGRRDIGPVWRVTYIHIKPGMADVFWKDFRENFKTLFDTYKHV